MLCQYSDLFGKPDQGLHSYRIFNIAIVDVILTLVGAYLLYFFLGKTLKWPYCYFLIILFIIGIIIHRLFCVKTTVDKLLFK